MTANSKTIFLVRKGADNCTISCTAVVNEKSNRSLVDTAAKNTVVKNSKFIEVEKSFWKKKGKIFFVITILGVVSDLITLGATGKNIWSYFF